MGNRNSRKLDDSIDKYTHPNKYSKPAQYARSKLERSKSKIKTSGLEENLHRNLSQSYQNVPNCSYLVYSAGGHSNVPQIAYDEDETELFEIVGSVSSTQHSKSFKQMPSQVPKCSSMCGDITKLNPEELITVLMKCPCPSGHCEKTFMKRQKDESVQPALTSEVSLPKEKLPSLENRKRTSETEEEKPKSAISIQKDELPPEEEQQNKSTITNQNSKADELLQLEIFVDENGYLQLDVVGNSDTFQLKEVNVKRKKDPEPINEAEPRKSKPQNLVIHPSEKFQGRKSAPERLNVLLSKSSRESSTTHVYNMSETSDSKASSALTESSKASSALTESSKASSALTESSNLTSAKSSETTFEDSVSEPRKECSGKLICACTKVLAHLKDSFRQQESYICYKPNFSARGTSQVETEIGKCDLDDIQDIEPVEKKTEEKLNCRCKGFQETRKISHELKKKEKFRKPKSDCDNSDIVSLEYLLGNQESKKCTCKVKTVDKSTVVCVSPTVSRKMQQSTPPTNPRPPPPALKVYNVATTINSPQTFKISPERQISPSSPQSTQLFQQMRPKPTQYLPESSQRLESLAESPSEEMSTKTSFKANATFLSYQCSISSASLTDLSDVEDSVQLKTNSEKYCSCTKLSHASLLSRELSNLALDKNLTWLTKAPLSSHHLALERISNPSAKLIYLMEVKYNKKLKTIEELCNKPNEMISFLQTGTLENNKPGSDSIRSNISFQAVVNSLISGI